jgi:rubredoxin
MRLEDKAEDLLKKAMDCETVEELLKLAKGNNIRLTEQEAVKLLEMMNPATGELSDSELDAVTGGGEKGPGVCPSCGIWFEWRRVKDYWVCLHCGYRKEQDNRQA